MKKISASDLATCREFGDAPTREIAKWFPDSDPRLIAAVEKWHQAAKSLDEADREIEALAREEGWLQAGESE